MGIKVFSYTIKFGKIKEVFCFFLEFWDLTDIITNKEPLTFIGVLKDGLKISPCVMYMNKAIFCTVNQDKRRMERWTRKN